MRTKLPAILSLLLLAVVTQTLLPLLSGELTIANPFLAVLAVLAIRQGKGPGVLWGALLGGVSDAYLLPYVGFHGIAFAVTGLLLGWIGTLLLLRGILPLFFFTLGAYVLDAALVTLLFKMLGLTIPRPILVPVAAGGVITALMAVGLEWVARRLWPKDEP